MYRPGIAWLSGRLGEEFWYLVLSLEVASGISSSKLHRRHRSDNLSIQLLFEVLHPPGLLTDEELQVTRRYLLSTST